MGTQTVKKIHREKPKTPWEKFKLRIAVAKVSKKLDLSSRKVWDVETDDASIGNSDSQDKINGIELIFPCKTVYDDNKVETDGLKVDVNAPSSNNSYERSIDEENNAVFAAVSHPASPTHAAQAIKKADSIDSLEVPIIVDLSFKLNCIPASVLKLTGEILQAVPPI